MTTVDARSRALYGANISDADVRRRFADGRWPVAVFGLGKMGLPVAAVFAEVTGAVVGVDLDAPLVDRINRGESPIEHEPGLDALVSDLVSAGSLKATTDGVAAAERATVHLLLVPTVLDGRQPDLSNLRAATREVGRGLNPGDVVLVESTIPPHTCERDVQPILAAESGLETDQFGVACCPERTSSGRAIRDIRESHPRVVGGVDDESTRIARLLYGEITANEVIPVADAATAACVKLFEGVYRDVNIALANELATFADDLGVDVRGAIQAANSQPFCDIHAPGPGVGGHCIPFYPWFLLDGRTQPGYLIRTARTVNERMPAFAAGTGLARLEERGILPDQATALLLGVAYRAGVPETRMAPAIDVAAALADRGVSVFAVDPLLEELPPMDAEPVELASIHGLDPDLVMIVTPHEAFGELNWAAFDEPVVVDCHDALEPGAVPYPVYTLGSV